LNLTLIVMTALGLAACGLLCAVVLLRKRLVDRAEAASGDRDLIRELRLRLAHTRRMEAVGIYAGSIVHNLTDLISVIQGNLRLADAGRDRDQPPHEELQKAAAAGRTAGDLLAGLGRFYHQAHAERKPVDLEPLVGDTVKFLADLLPPNVELRSDLLPCGPVLASAAGIQQVLMNLCSPSSPHVGQGMIHITLREEIVASGRNAQPHPIPEGSYARLSIRDSRPSPDSETLDRILETYYSGGPGLEEPGLGLATVSRFIEHKRGTGKPESGDAQGTDFSIYFPLIAWRVISEESDLDTPDLDLPLPEDLVRIPPAHILLVEDEELVADVLARGLRSLGFPVTVAPDGRKALDVFCASPETFDVVITDQIMPHMSGVRLARELRAVRKDLPVILVTGFHNSYQEQQAREAGIREFIPKPCSHLDLARAIGRLSLGRLEGRA